MLTVGIIGLPNAGKSTLFNALTHSHQAPVASYPFCTIEPNVGVIEVPDERLDRLVPIYESAKKIPAAVEFFDIAGLVRGASQGEGLGNRFLAHIREVDAIVEVVRCFEEQDVAHVAGGEAHRLQLDRVARRARGLCRDALILLESIWIGMARSTDVYAKPGEPSLTDGFAHWEATNIGGLTPDGRDATNELSYLILKSKREFPLNYPDLSARIHSRTPDAFLHAICETIKEGTGFPKLFFDEEIVPSLLAKGADVEEANDYNVTGCSEVKMVNRDTIATGCAWINLGAILEMALADGRLKAFDNDRVGVETGDPRSFGSFEDLWTAFRLQAENVMKHTFIQQYKADTLKSSHIASPMFSMLHDLCMAECKDIHSGPIEGGLYLGFFDIIGFGTVIDSLAAIKKLVFDDRKLGMDELLEALEVDFEGREAVRQMCLGAPKYGNNDPYVDSIGHDIEECFARLAHAHTTAFGGELDVRYVSVTSHVPLGMVVGATPDGRKSAEPLSESISPSQGRDVRGPTATLTSIANTKCSQFKERAARLLNMKLSPASVAGEAGTKKLMALIRTACDMKMWHIQFNIINRETLLAAQKDPEKYRNLLVRVAGYSAYFVDLTPALQSEIIRRTEHGF